MISIRATDRFNNSFQRAQPLLKCCAQGALRDLVARIDSDQRVWIRSYKPVEGIREDVREMGISNGDRLLFHVRDGVVYLLEMGKHEIVNHYVATERISSELRRAGTLPNELKRLEPAGFFTFDVETQWRAFANEADPQWLCYLDTQQAAVAKAIIQCAQAAKALPRVWHLALLLGGPGTGKTSILLNLFDHAFHCDLMPEFIVSDELSAYVASATFIDLEPYRTSLERAKQERRGDILLVDDPDSLDHLESVKWLAQSRKYAAVVAAFDPLQVVGQFDDDFLAHLSSGKGAVRYELTACYAAKGGGWPSG